MFSCVFAVCSSFKDGVSGSLIQNKDFRKCCYRLIFQYLEKEIEINDVITAISVALDNVPAKLSLFMDVLTTIDTEVSILEDRDLKSQFYEFLLASKEIIPVSIFKERIDPETLQSAGFLTSQKLFNQKLVRTKTKLFYKQQKYNLLREENEGYAKLITELSQDGILTKNSSQLLQNVLSLLGYFNLDPNRVLDILLEAFECKVDEDLFFVPLVCSYLRHCDVSGLAHLVGFKFQFYHQSIEETTPTSLYKLTAILLRNNLLEFKKLYPHLKPSDKELSQQNQRTLDEAKVEAKKLTTINLTEVTDEKDADKKEAEKEIEMKTDNQKFGLCLALIELGAWSQVYPIICQLPDNLLMANPTIARALCHLIHCTIEPLYRSKFSPKAAVGNVYRTSRGYPQPCLQYEQLNDAVFPMLLKLGPNLSIDPVLLVKVIRVAKGFMKEYNQSNEAADDKMEATYAAVLSLIEDVLFPSLSVLECNCGVAEEMWGLLKRLPYEIRYRLYAYWKNYAYTIHPALIVAKAKTIKRAKYITKRLSKDNLKPSGRHIGKLSHCNPCIIFDHHHDLIQRYDNFIGPMVDALKYLNPLAYDVLAFCIIEALANPAKQRMKQSDTNLSAWLQSLSQFCGAVFKKYPTDITGLLQYIANQLKAGKSLDLLVLKEVVQKMSGVEANDEITPSQLEALAGGELLKAEGAYFGQIRNTRKPSMRLRDALMEGKLTLPLCLLIAQQRNAIVYVEEQSRHLKLIGKLYDQCQDNLIQFGGFLTNQLSTHDYQATLPSLDELHHTYGVTPDASFFLTRPVYKYEIQEKVKSLQLAYSEKNDFSKQKQLDMEKSFSETCDDIFRPVVESAIPLQASKIWNNLSPLLYVTFWSLSMYDLYTPRERYVEEEKKLKVTKAGVDDNKEIPSSSKKKKEKERCEFLIEKLVDEQKTQIDHNKFIKVWLESRKNAWFPSKLAKGETITQFLQLCIFPRCVFSANDAVYCAKFIQTIHTLKSPNFSTLICFDRTFSDVSYIVASLTENEASRYGRFLCAMLQMVMRWHGDKKLYDKECGNLPGFLTILRATNSEKATYLDYENFRHVCHKWQYKLTKALILGIESKDYTQIRNTLLVLIKIIPHYPQVHNLGQALERRIEKIIEDEKDNRHDLQALAIGYNGLLKARKSSMVPENQFHNIKEKEKEKVEQTKPGKVSQSSKTTIKSETIEVTDKPIKVVSVKKEDHEKVESSSDSKRSSRSDISVSRSEREKEIIEDSEWKKSSSRSPKAHSTLTDRTKIIEDSSHKDRGDKKDRPRERPKESDKERRSRLSSPSSNDDLKRRKLITDDHQKSTKRDSLNEKKTERKRTSTEPEQKESKRRKEDIVMVDSPDHSSKKTESHKKEKIKKEKIHEEKVSKKESRTESKRDLKDDGKQKRKKTRDN